MLDGEFDKARQVFYPELLHQMAAVRLHGFRGQKKNFRNFAVRLSFYEKLQNRPLARTQSVQGTFRLGHFPRPEVIRNDRVGQRLAEV